MRKKNKHPEWQMSKSERSWYYVGDIGRMFRVHILAFSKHYRLLTRLLAMEVRE